MCFTDMAAIDLDMWISDTVTWTRDSWASCGPLPPAEPPPGQEG